MGKQKHDEKKAIEDVEYQQPEPIYINEKPGFEQDSSQNDVYSLEDDSITKYKYFGPLLAVSLVITGSLNTIVAK